MKLTVKNMEGKDQGELEIKFALIEDSSATQAVHDTVVAFNAAQRMGTACTKNVGDVAGTNKKPWRQKGTGRARAGSFQSPLWRGGGVVFGPKPRDYSKKTNRAVKKLALRKALSERLKAGDVLVIDDLKLANGKTKDFMGVLGALNLDGGTALIVRQGSDINLNRAARNVGHVELTTGEELNTYQVLRSDKVLFTKGAFETLSQRLTEE